MEMTEILYFLSHSIHCTKDHFRAWDTARPKGDSWSYQGDSVSFLHPRAGNGVHAYFWSQAVMRIIGLENGQLWESLPEVPQMLCRWMANEPPFEGWVPLAWVEERKGCPDTGSNLNWGWGRKCWVWASQSFTLASLTHRNASETGRAFRGLRLQRLTKYLPLKTLISNFFWKCYGYYKGRLKLFSHIP